MPQPLYAYSGMLMQLAIIQSVQFSIFLSAMSHIAVKNMPELSISTQFDGAIVVSVTL